jgi:NhaA family Na+:H+ antiporter
MQPTTPTISRLQAFQDFFRGGAAGGIVLIFSAAVALILANSPAADEFEALLHLRLGIVTGSFAFAQPLDEWVNDGLMALFFLVVGLEIRREMTEGELASMRRAAGPAVAALGGMVVPALIYIAICWRDPSALRGWAIPVATDIAFSLAVLRALGNRVPAGPKVFLAALAIIDDLGAILVIAFFYTEQLDFGALGADALVLLALYGLRRAGVRALGPYMAGFILLWVFTFRSGVHATLAGVALAFIVPAEARGGESPARALEHSLTGWVAYFVLPLFGLANAGLRFDSLSASTFSDPIVPGIIAGLFVGKQVGVFGATWAATKLRLIHLPTGLTWPLVYGVSVLCGIGFTMSLFIGDLAFHNGSRQSALRLAVFAGSLLSAAGGVAALSVATRRKTKAVPSQSANGVSPHRPRVKP